MAAPATCREQGFRQCRLRRPTGRKSICRSSPAAPCSTSTRAPASRGRRRPGTPGARVDVEHGAASNFDRSTSFRRSPQAPLTEDPCSLQVAGAAVVQRTGMSNGNTWDHVRHGTYHLNANGKQIRAASRQRNSENIRSCPHTCAPKPSNQPRQIATSMGNGVGNRPVHSKRRSLFRAGPGRRATCAVAIQ